MKRASIFLQSKKLAFNSFRAPKPSLPARTRRITTPIRRPTDPVGGHQPIRHVLHETARHTFSLRSRHWRLDICEAAGGRFFLIEPRWGRQTVAQGAVSGRSRCGRPGWAFPPIYTLSPNTFLVLGEREGVRGSKPLTSQPHASLAQSWKAQRNAWFRIALGCPPSPPEFPKGRSFGGRGVESR